MLRSERNSVIPSLQTEAADHFEAIQGKAIFCLQFQWFLCSVFNSE
jgi:hypothetical protein